MHRTLSLDIPTFGFLIGTRVALAFGAGLLMSEYLAPTRRRALGRTLVVGGILTTPPAVGLLRRALTAGRRPKTQTHSDAIRRDERLIGVERFPRQGNEFFADESSSR